MIGALASRSYVLDEMHGKGFLNDAQWAAAKKEPVTLAPASDPTSDLAPEAVEMAKAVPSYRVEPEQARLGGFTVTTSIDPKLQTAARKAVRDALGAYDKRHGLLGPLKPPSPVAEKKKALAGATRSCRTRGPRASISTGCWWGW